MPANCGRLRIRKEAPRADYLSDPVRGSRQAVALLLALLAGPITGSAQTQPQPALPEVTLRAGMHVIRAELANTHESRMRGLMFREVLGLNAGMIFVFEHAERQCFWMKNTPLPLSIAFIADDGTIVNIAHMAPRSEKTHCSSEPVAIALEMSQGWFAAKGIKAGDRLQSQQLFRQR